MDVQYTGINVDRAAHTHTHMHVRTEAAINHLVLLWFLAVAGTNKPYLKPYLEHHPHSNQHTTNS